MNDTVTWSCLKELEKIAQARGAAYVYSLAAGREGTRLARQNAINKAVPTVRSLGTARRQVSSDRILQNNLQTVQPMPDPIKMPATPDPTPGVN